MAKKKTGKRSAKKTAPKANPTADSVNLTNSPTAQDAWPAWQPAVPQ